jgi:hypothetical protein
MDRNPYNAPRSPLYGTARVPRRSAESLDVEPVGRGRRFANMMIDSVAYFALYIGYFMLMVMIEGPRFISRAQHMSPLESYLIGVLILIFYYVIT